VLAENHLAGHDSHGILRIPQYVDGDPRRDAYPDAHVPTWSRETSSSTAARRRSGRVRAGDGSNFAADLVADEGGGKSGTAAISVVEIGHTGRLAAFTERAARRRHRHLHVDRDRRRFATHGAVRGS
jgi:hydroxycarboxylate dehydrogenase B